MQIRLEYRGYETENKRRRRLAEFRPTLANRSGIAAREVSAGGMKLLNVDEIAEPRDALIVG